VPTDSLDLIGKTIADKYVVESVVGEGGFAVVYRARHLIWKRPVALKVFKALGDFSAKDRDKLVEEFIQEGSLLADLSERSASIVQARDIGTLTTPRGESIPYMVLEWLDGASLEQVLADEKSRGAPPRSLADAVKLLEPAAEAIALAHKKGIAHRDLKPGNIFVLGEPRGDGTIVKVLDFGIAKVVSDAQKMAGSFTKTSGQVTSFTPAYGAPEQFSRTHGATGPWTDVFSFSLIVSEVITGRDPLEGDDVVQLAVASGNPARRPTPRTLGAHVSDAAEAVFARAVAVKPTERFATMGDFWNALRNALDMAPMRGITAPKPSSITPQKVDDIAIARTVAVSELEQKQSIPSTTATAPAAPSSGGKGILFGVIAIAVVAVGGVGIYVMVNKASPAGATAPIASAPPSASVAAGSPASAAPSHSAGAHHPHGGQASCPDDMIHVKASRFFMGSNLADSEKPEHQVSLDAYCIDKYEVTVEQYKACSDNGGCLRASTVNEHVEMSAKEHAVYDELCNIKDPAAHSKHPINCVSWDQASKFCKEHGKRLPTEAEWEFAARGPDGRKYPWGDEEPTAGYLNACGKECVAWGKKNGMTFDAMYEADDGFATTAPVGSFAKGASPFGVNDVVGNVWEWVSDWYGPYAEGEATNPRGATSPEKNGERVIRGGAWNGSRASWVRPTFRFKSDPKARSYGVGFRCAK
jgi:formylglycine-generating enzyme required for sulfatase activity